MAISKFPLPTYQTIDFISSSTWTVPADVYSADFLIVGAGGGGGGTDNSVNTRTSVGGGGGGGAVKSITLPTTPGSVYTITVGAKGTGGNATAGGNGGFSEVILSGVTLVQSFGGGGGAGVTAADAVVLGTVTQSVAGAGGLAYSATANCFASGGGGALRFAEQGTFDTFTTYSVEGRQPYIGSAITAGLGYLSFGQLGIDGFGSGGGGSYFSGGDAAVATPGAAPYGAGKGVYVRVGTAVNTNGGAATIAGCGGGGAISSKTTNAATGGHGYDGLIRISYYG